jgi:hypothetical protein
MNVKRKADDAKPTSGTFRTRKSDGAELQKKGYWLNAKNAHAFEIWCVINRRDESQVVDELIAEFLKKQPKR